MIGSSLAWMLLAAAAAQTPIPAAAPAGEARSCIPLSQVRDTRVRDDSTIDFVTGRGRAYRTVLPQPCPELGAERAFSYATSLSQLCSTDIITVYRNGGQPRRGASCGLGRFQPILLPERARR